MTIEKREALGLRGRFGCDVWQNYVDAPRDTQIRFLTRQGVPEARMTQVRAELYAILYDEGIWQTH